MSAHLVSVPPLSWSWPLRCSEICWPLHWRRLCWGPWRGPLWPASRWPGLTSWSPSLEVWDHQRDVMCSVTTCSSYHWSLFTVQYCHFWMFYKAKAHNSDFAFRLLSSDLISVGPGPMSKLCSIYLGLRFKTGFLKHEQLLSDAQQKLWWLISSMTYGFTAAAKTARQAPEVT